MYDTYTGNIWKNPPTVTKKIREKILYLISSRSPPSPKMVSGRPSSLSTGAKIMNKKKVCIYSIYYYFSVHRRSYFFAVVS